MSNTKKENQKPRTMRDTLIERITEKMHTNDDIFFLAADLGSPALDRLREEFPDSEWTLRAMPYEAISL